MDAPESFTTEMILFSLPATDREMTEYQLTSDADCNIADAIRRLRAIEDECLPYGLVLANGLDSLYADAKKGNVVIQRALVSWYLRLAVAYQPDVLRELEMIATVDFDELLQ